MRILCRESPMLQGGSYDWGKSKNPAVREMEAFDEKVIGGYSSRSLEAYEEGGSIGRKVRWSTVKW